MKKITEKLIEEVSQQAKDFPRRRCNYNFHDDFDDLLQRLLNALEPDTYICPHKHENPDKREIFIILTGRVLVVEFDEKGIILDHVILDSDGGVKGVEIPPKTYHTFIGLKEGAVSYEFKDGPYHEGADKGFADWAPEEGSPDGSAFNAKVLKELGVKQA